MPTMRVGPPLRLGPLFAFAHAAAATDFSVGGSKTPERASASSTSRGCGTIGEVAGRRAAGIGAKGAAAGAIGAGAPFVGDSNGLPDRLGMGAGDVGSGC